MLWSGRGIRNEDKKCQHIAVCWQREKSPDVNVQYHHSIWVDNSQAARAKTRIYFWGISPLTGLIKRIRDRTRIAYEVWIYKMDLGLWEHQGS